MIQWRRDKTVREVKEKESEHRMYSERERENLQKKCNNDEEKSGSVKLKLI